MHLGVISCAHDQAIPEKVHVYKMALTWFVIKCLHRAGVLAVFGRLLLSTQFLIYSENKLRVLFSRKMARRVA